MLTISWRNSRLFLHSSPLFSLTWGGILRFYWLTRFVRYCNVLKTLVQCCNVDFSNFLLNNSTILETKIIIVLILFLALLFRTKNPITFTYPIMSCLNIILLWTKITIFTVKHWRKIVIKNVMAYHFQFIFFLRGGTYTWPLCLVQKYWARDTHRLWLLATASTAMATVIKISNNGWHCSHVGLQCQSVFILWRNYYFNIVFINLICYSLVVLSGKITIIKKNSNAGKFLFIHFECSLFSHVIIVKNLT